MPGYDRTEQLPSRFPVFPLSGCLLFPRGILPLNIFEPRYLNMIDDAMAGNGFIGMVQSLGTGPKDYPDIARVGCLGRIASYSETEDGRYLISLAGICRFRIADELPFERPYRAIEADWGRFEADLGTQDASGLPTRESILGALRDYLQKRGMQADWTAAENAPLESLIHALCGGCPFSVLEKQALLEAPDLKARCELLIALLEVDAKNNGGSSWLQ